MKTFPAHDIAIVPGSDSVYLWYIRPMTYTFWPTKVVAEAMARQYFPDEDIDTRHARIGYRVFNLEN